ncbi:MAG: fasciclin domain-containing protein, partial [Acidimicrobiales bacterium]|nr:fasciclin domain-containing protein [Acidimicrobiales bacterium]
TTLVTAVGEAGLVDTLNGPGPFTIFAPTDDAFAALPEGALDAILADKDLLTAVLTNHVISGDLKAADLGSASTQSALSTEELSFNAEGTVVNGIDVICSNVPVGNGTVHIVDQVILPQAAIDALNG